MFQPEAYSAFLSEMSVSPDVRISIGKARLGYLSTYEDTKPELRRRRRPAIRLPWFKSPKPVAPASERVEANQALVYRTAVDLAVDPRYFVALAGRESGFDHLAKAPTSSATGLFQFTENTWLCVLKLYGLAYGVHEAGSITRGWDGKCRTASKPTRWRLLALRYDPQLNATMAGLHTRDNRLLLREILRREPDSMELYALHFFGSVDGQRFLLSRSDDIGAKVTPKAARSNRSLFYSRSGRPLFVFEIQQNLSKTFKRL